jgi:hypothetical protein
MIKRNFFIIYFTFNKKLSNPLFIPLIPFIYICIKLKKVSPHEKSLFKVSPLGGIDHL